ncbi:MAG: hypothetical protein ACRCYR_03705 [Phycicoccus sp.]
MPNTTVRHPRGAGMRAAPDYDVMLRWARTIIYLDAAWLMLLGCVLAASGNQRFGSPTFASLADGAAAVCLSPQWLGAPFVIAGATLTVGGLTNLVAARVAGYMFGALASFIFVAGGIAAAVETPTTALTPIVTYGFTGVLQLTMVSGSVQSWVLAYFREGE